MAGCQLLSLPLSLCVSRLCLYTWLTNLNGCSWQTSFELIQLVHVKLIIIIIIIIINNKRVLRISNGVSWGAWFPGSWVMFDLKLNTIKSCKCPMYNSLEQAYLAHLVLFQTELMWMSSSRSWKLIYLFKKQLLPVSNFVQLQKLKKTLQTRIPVIMNHDMNG